MLIKIGQRFIGQTFIGKLQPSPKGAPWFDTWVDGGERFIRLGKVEIVHTPRPARGSP